MADLWNKKLQNTVISNFLKVLIIEITEKVGNTAEERIKFASPLGEYMLIGGIYSTQL